MAPAGMHEHPLSALAAHVPGDGETGPDPEPQPGGRLRRAGLGSVEPEPRADAQVAEPERVLGVGCQRPAPGLHARGRDLDLEGTAPRPVDARRPAVEEASPTRDRALARLGLETDLHAGLEPLEPQGRVNGGRQREAGARPSRVLAASSARASRARRR